MRVITAAEWLEEANRRLRNHPDFAQGMAFVAYPVGSEPDSARGYTWQPDPGAMHPFTSIATTFNTEVIVN